MSEQIKNNSILQNNTVIITINVFIFAFLQLTMVILGKLTSYMTFLDFLKAFSLTLIVFILSIFWAYISDLIRKYKEFEEIESQDLASTVKKLNSNIKKMETLVNMKNPLYKHIISNCYDHYTLLSKIQNDLDPIQSIQFLGTMVGFSYIYPFSIVDHIFSPNNGGSFYVDIIGTKSNLKENKAEKNFVYYPISLVIKTIKYFIEEYQSKKADNTDISKTITFEIYYYPHEIIEAFVAFGEEKVIAYNALEPTNTQLIYKKQYMGINLDYDEPKAKRYLDLFKRFKEQIQEKQTWTFSFDDATLTVEGKSFWRFKKESIVFKKIEVEKKDNNIKLNGLDQIKNFIENSYTNLTKECQLIKNTDERIQKELFPSGKKSVSL